jgi:hypothetical protein
MNNNRRNIVIMSALFAGLCLLSAGCASVPKEQDDPLRYTKKLVTEGHATLYHNGAFQVPHTEIRLIPAGPDALELAGEMMGLRARESFVTALKNAADSVQIVADGTKLTYRTAKKMHEGTEKAVETIRSMARENSTLVVYRSTDIGKSLIGTSWELAGDTLAMHDEIGKDIMRGGRRLGSRISDTGTDAGTTIARSSLAAAKDLSAGSVERSGGALSYAGRSFVMGYATVPKKLKESASSMGDHLSEARFAGILQEENERRAALSGTILDLMAGTMSDYPANVAGSFGKAKQSLTGNYRTTGVPLAVLSSIRWVLQGLLWDATIKPAVNITGASVGYIGVNLVAFPAIVLVREGAATTSLAVQVSWDAARMGYSIVAPTGTAALAGVYGVLDFTGSHLAAGATAAGGTTLGLTAAAGSKTVGVAVKTGGYAAGAATEYIAVPLASAGIAVGGGTIGTVVGVAGTVAGGTVLVAGETTAAATEVFGNVITGVALAGGTAASTGAGAAVGVYELAKAVVVPAGYELGGGIVLSYGTLSHLAAHSILAVSDCAYLVLSLEGPRWVLYAVRGKVSSGDELAAGAAVDLKELRAQGEEIYNLPVSDEEMKKIVESVYENLPESRE